MGPLSTLGENISELLHELGSGIVFGNDTFFISQYTVWMLVALVVVFLLVFAAKRRLALVPESKLSNGIEYLVEFVRRDIGEGVIGAGSEKHLSLLLAVFFFILINNLIGLIPGCKPGTGTFSITFALSLIVFVYFNIWGMKQQGVGHYIINLAPKGVFPPLAVLIWCIELVSLFLRLITLAVRLFANMYAGHIVLGAFSLLTTMFITYAIQNAAWATALPSIAWMLLLILMYAMELLVACIQAYVFTLLTAVYISLAGGEH